MPVKGTYCLCIENHRKQSIKIGALGEIVFNKGYFVYVGSAQNSLYPRIQRHLKTSRGEHHVTHWHIDYFLREKAVDINSVYVIEADERLECHIVEHVSKHGEPVPSFGSSDCKCASHLIKVDDFDYLEKIGMKRLRDFPRLPGSSG